jgi:hypothetical protein
LCGTKFMVSCTASVPQEQAAYATVPLQARDERSDALSAAGLRPNCAVSPCARPCAQIESDLASLEQFREKRNAYNERVASLTAELKEAQTRHEEAVVELERKYLGEKSAAQKVRVQLGV